MAFDTKEDLQKICEAVIAYQKGLEDIDKYIGRLNGRIGELTERGAGAQTEEIFTEYSNMLEEIEKKLNHFDEMQQKLTKDNEGLADQLKQLRRFSYAVRNFEESMEDFSQRADTLSQKLYNKDFNNAIKSMNSIAGDSRRSGTYEYQHFTNHDLDILQHEYKLVIGDGLDKQDREMLDSLVTDIIALFGQVKLKRSSHEALQRLMEKLFHSRSEALEKFKNAISDTSQA